MSWLVLAALLAGSGFAQDDDGPEGGNADSSAIAVIYYPRCSHCARFLASGAAPFVEAKLPGDVVTFSLLPWVDAGGHPSTCTLTALCGLKRTFPSFPKPSPADAPTLKTGVQYAACVVVAENSAEGCTVDALKDCAAQAGLPWDGESGLNSCTFGPEAHQIAADAVPEMHADEGFGPSPFVFVNNKCQPGWDGSLFYLACNALRTKPAMCSDELALEEAAKQRAKEWVPPVLLQKAHKPIEPCENCVEIGSFHWDPAAGSPSVRLVALAATGLAAAAAMMVAARAWGRWARSPWQGMVPLQCSDEEDDFGTE